MLLHLTLPREVCTNTKGHMFTASVEMLLFEAVCSDLHGVCSE